MNGKQLELIHGSHDFFIFKKMYLTFIYPGEQLTEIKNLFVKGVRAKTAAQIQSSDTMEKKKINKSYKHTRKKILHHVINKEVNKIPDHRRTNK